MLSIIRSNFLSFDFQYVVEIKFNEFPVVKINDVRL